MLGQIAPLLSRHLGFICAGWPIRYVVFPIFQTARGPWGGYVYLPLWREHGLQIGTTVLGEGEKRTIVDHWMTYPSHWITFRENPLKGTLVIVTAAAFLQCKDYSQLLRDTVSSAPPFPLPATSEELARFMGG